MTGGLWRIAAECPAALAPAFAEVLDDLVESVALVPDEGAGTCRLEAIAARPPDRPDLELRLELVAASLGTTAPALAIEPLPAIDWLARNRASFAPVVAGPFVVHGEVAPPRDRVALRIDAATAFGTGEHPTTRGCLIALAHVARMRRPRCALDMGTGSGVLAIGLARLARVPVTAVDNDPEAVAVATRHARLNRVGGLVRVALADGYRAPAVRRAAPYDLVVANILARPLARMAGDLANALAPGGHAILSGLLEEQERMVLAPHRARGLALMRRYRLGGWTTLVLARHPPIG